MGPAALDQAKRDGVRVVTSDSIYELENLIDQFKEALEEKAKKNAERDVVLPVTFRILRDFSKAPMVLGCEITAGQLRVGTPLCVAVDGETSIFGQVAGIQKNGESTLIARTGDQVGVEIAQSTEQCRIKYGKGKALFKDGIVFSRVTRQSANALRQHFSEQMLAEDWSLLEKLCDIK